MKTSLAIILMTLAWLGVATTASAYKFSPPDTSVRLHGMLTFTPNEGGDPPFKCGATLNLKTKTNQITAVKFTSGNCEDIHFQTLPFGVAILTANSGEFAGGSFSSGGGICGEEFNQFQVNGSGVWTLPAGECISGTLTSRPTTTIVK